MTKSRTTMIFGGHCATVRNVVSEARAAKTSCNRVATDIPPDRLYSRCVLDWLRSVHDDEVTVHLEPARRYTSEHIGVSQTYYSFVLLK